MKFRDVAPPGMKELVREQWSPRQGESGPSRSELELVKKNGEHVWLDCTATALQYKGKPAMLLMVLDITGRKRIETELKRSEEKYRSLVENIQDMVWETDENNQCTYTSPRCREILGYEPEDVIGKMPFEFMARDEADRVTGLVKPLLDAHKPFELLDYYVIRKDGRKAFLETNGMPVFDDMGRFKGYRGVNRDITNGRR
jgi:PAS domain S-box-containing protein